MIPAIITAAMITLASSNSDIVESHNLRPLRLLSPLEFKTEKIEGIITPHEISRLYLLDVDMGGNQGDGVELANPDNQTEKVAVSNCKEFGELKKDGWLASTTYDISMESFFKKTCGALDIVAHATPAKETFFGETIVIEKDIKNYPKEFLELISVAGPQEGSRCQNAKTLDQCIQERNGKIEVAAGNIVFEDEDYSASYTPMLSADINHDGFEDILFSYGYHVKDGTFRNYGYVCLERTGEAERIKVFPCPDSD